MRPRRSNRLKKKTMYLALLCLLMFASSGYGEDAQAVLDQVNAGVEAGNAIIGIFSDDNFSNTFNQISTIAAKIGPFLGAIGPAITLISIFLPSSPTPEMQYMKEQFTKMDENFDKVFTRFNEVENLIKETSLKDQYGGYELTILDLSHRLQQFLDAPTDAMEGQKATFISAYESSYDGAPYKLWLAMMEEPGLAHNIPQTTIDYTDNHRGRVQKIMKGVTNLIIQGVKVHLSYLKAKGRDATYEDEKNAWEDHIEELIQHMQQVDQNVKNVWHSQVKTDLSDKLALLNGQSNSAFADEFYSFVNDKYDWRDWFVVAYKELSGENRHWQKWCWGDHSFRHFGRNVVIASVDKGKSAINTENAEYELKSIDAYYSRWYWFIKRTHIYGARTMYEKLPASFTNGCTYAAVGYIDDTGNASDIQHRGPSHRLVVTSNSIYEAHAFG